MSENVDSRKTLHSAYTFVRSAESNRAISSLTLDHLLQEQISSIKPGETRDLLDGRGASVGSRVSKVDRLDELQRSLSSLTEALRAGDNRSLEGFGLAEEE